MERRVARARVMESRVARAKTMVRRVVARIVRRKCEPCAIMHVHVRVHHVHVHVHASCIMRRMTLCGNGAWFE
eukprot:4149404-Prymnesium_polylepis.1